MKKSTFHILLLFFILSLNSSCNSEFAAFNLYEYLSFEEIQKKKAQAIYNSLDLKEIIGEIDTTASLEIQGLQKQIIPIRGILSEKQRNKVVRLYKKILKDEDDSKLRDLKAQLYMD